MRHSRNTRRTSPAPTPAADGAVRALPSAAERKRVRAAAAAEASPHEREIRMSQDSLVVEDLTKVYRKRGREDVVALGGVSFALKKGEIVALLGENGAGKTTAIKCACTLIRPTSGRVLIDGVDPVHHPRATLGKISAVLEGNRNVYWQLTVRQNLEFFAGLQGIPFKRVRPYVDELLRTFRLDHKVDTVARMLSRGMQQKLALACALVKQTDILLLDEPTLGLDVTTSIELRTVLQSMAAREDRTIMLSSHDMGVVEAVCDRVIIMHQGRVLVDDRLAKLLDLFRPKAYRCRLAEQLTERQEQAIRAHFPGADVRSRVHDDAAEVEISAPEGFYEVVSVLRDAGASVHSIERRPPTLEEVFLAITQETRAAPARPAETVVMAV